MSEPTIHLGYEIGTGTPVSIPLGHLCVTGQSQLSGKTTTLEALVARSGLRAVSFVTKRGERSFQGGHRISPYFRERADWRFVESILESAMRQRMRFERAWIVRASRGAHTLADVQRNVRRLQADAKRSMDADVYMLLGEYLELVVPLIEKLPASPTLALARGLNVMDLGAYPSELQALVIRSVMEWIYERERAVVTIVPEAWEFIPQRRGGPVKLAAIDLSRKGAGLLDYLWLDSQDLAGVDKEIVRQASVWLLGVQREANEIKRTLAHIPAGVKRPKADDVANLRRGVFFACMPGAIHRVYVQPAWLAAATAIEVARDDGSEKVRAPEHALAPATEHVPEERAMTKTDKTDEKLDALIALMTKHLDGARAAPAVPGSQRAPKSQAHRTPPPELTAEQLADVKADRRRVLGGASVEEAYEEALYQRFKARLKTEAPALLKVLVTRPELEVLVERVTLEIAGNTLRGKLATLVARGWFDVAKSGSAAYLELRRQGFSTAKPNVYRELDALAALGFVTKEADGFEANREMKVNIVEGARRG